MTDEQLERYNEERRQRTKERMAEASARRDQREMANNREAYMTRNGERSLTKRIEIAHESPRLRNEWPSGRLQAGSRLVSIETSISAKAKRSTTSQGHLNLQLELLRGCNNLLYLYQQHSLLSESEFGSDVRKSLMRNGSIAVKANTHFPTYLTGSGCT